MSEPRVKRHPYFSMIDWAHVYFKRYIPPYIPPVDPSNALHVVIKASVRKTWAYWVTPLDLPPVDLSLDDRASALAVAVRDYRPSFTISNTSKAERFFVVEAGDEAGAPLGVGVELGREEVKAGLTKEEDEVPFNEES